MTLDLFGRLFFMECPHLTVPFEDWSGVRSPSRAKRRRRQGHPQRIVIRHRPDPDFYVCDVTGRIYAHPEAIRAAKLRLALPGVEP